MLGREDYASGGAVVRKHSVKADYFADPVRMITPSFGQPGECFGLKGNRGFVEIKLRSAIIPQAVTLEHVAKVINRSYTCYLYCYSVLCLVSTIELFHESLSFVGGEYIIIMISLT